jgi:hypothetical protein
METKFGRDFKPVGIHTDAQAAALCARINARAFTVGNDIFFAPGEYAPNTEAGRNLLAHELTHVAQQSRSAQRKIMRTNGSSTPSYPQSSGVYNLTTDPPSIIVAQLPVPSLKADPTTPITSFYRSHLYNRASDPFQDPLQQFKWLRDVSQGGAEAKLNTYGFQSARPYFIKSVGQEGNSRTGDKSRLADVLRIPFWDPAGNQASYDVDHYVELQTSGWPDDRTANDIGNLRLVKSSANQDFGRTINESVNDKVIEAVRSDTNLQSALNDRSITASQILSASTPIEKNRALGPLKRQFRVTFGQLSSNGSGPTAEQAAIWEKARIEEGGHIEVLIGPRINNPEAKRSSRIKIYDLGPEEHAGPATPFNSRVEDGIDTQSLIGSSEEIVFYVGELTGKRKKIPWTDIQTQNVDKISGLIISNLFKGQMNVTGFAFDRESTTPAAGSLTGSLRSYPKTTLALGGDISWPIKRVPGTQYSGYLDYRDLLAEINRLNPNFPGLSPIQFNQISEGADGICIVGGINATLPIIQNAGLEIVLEGNDLRIQKTFDTGEFQLPSPFEISGSSLTLFFGARSGFGIEGRLNFGIERIGEGFIGASASTGEGFALDGQFNFDERLFGEGTTAQVRVGYRDDQWSMGGTVTIPRGRVPGIRSATINVEYSQNAGFAARGDAQLDIPGVESGTLEVSHSEEAGFAIGGTFNLSPDAPGIRGGTITAQLRERPDGQGYALSARGEAQPDIPGINSNLIVSYDDGAFTAEVSADYRRGMLAGRITAGVTNRGVSEGGQLTDTAAPGNPLIVYGGGSVTIQIAPWLQGTAGIQFAPNGEVTVTGEIGLPSALEIFGRREINRSIFNIAVQIPIIPGIVAEVGGGLGAVAGIGPGMLDQLRLGITYNPAHEENTRITGDAHLRVPADAGLRLSVRAGIGLGITGASATGGLEIGGTLGIEGAAEAGVHVEWAPTTGLDLSAEVSIHAQPSFTFDISGYVSVRALGFSIYDQRWQLASLRFGSDLRFGISLPIHYHEGEPFDISLDDVRFEVPEIDAGQLLRGLIDRIA